MTRFAPRALTLALILMLSLSSCTSGQQGGPGTEGGEGSQPGATGNLGPVPEGVDGVYDVCWSGEVTPSSGPISLVDRTEPANLVDPLLGVRGHAAAWGDVDGDGFVDLVVGTFATARSEVYLQRGAEGPAPDQVLLGNGTGFTPMDDFPEQYGRSSGAALVDLDGDGDLDLVLSRNVTGREEGASTAVFENTGGSFVEADSGIDPELAGRSIGVLDVDNDSRLDLVFLEDHYQGRSSRIYLNNGNLTFVDESERLGFPSDVHGLGVAIGDLDRDGNSDIFIAGSNRLFLGTGDGVVEVPSPVGDFEAFGPEDDVAGAAIADVNRDGWLDLLVGHHYNSTVDRDTEFPVRLYLNRGAREGTVELEEVTEEAGLIGLPTKAPHVEFADMDNDGWLDVVTSASAEDGTKPAIFHNDGSAGEAPHFTAPEGLGSEQYWVSAPTADYDRDGRLDLFAVEWDPGLPSILFSNDSATGHWIEVSVADAYGGVGARVEVFAAGSGGEEGALIGAREITATVGYTAGVELTAHFGLGNVESVDIVVTPHGAGPIEIGDVPVDARILVGGNC